MYYARRMRSFSAPKSFDVRRRRTEAAGALRRFVGDAWDASGGDLNALWASTRHLKETVDTELLPAARSGGCVVSELYHSRLPR